MKATIIILSILSLFVLGIIYAPKGTDYVKYEKTMIDSGQMNPSNSIYFNN